MKTSLVRVVVSVLFVLVVALVVCSSYSAAIGVRMFRFAPSSARTKMHLFKVYRPNAAVEVAAMLIRLKSRGFKSQHRDRLACLCCFVVYLVRSGDSSCNLPTIIFSTLIIFAYLAMVQSYGPIVLPTDSVIK